MLANLNWNNDFPNAVVIHESFRGSDYCPIIFNVDGVKNKSKSPFRFEASWLESKDCAEVIKAVWQHNINGSFFAPVACLTSV